MHSIQKRLGVQYHGIFDNEEPIHEVLPILDTVINSKEVEEALRGAQFEYILEEVVLHPRPLTIDCKVVRTGFWMKRQLPLCSATCGNLRCCHQRVPEGASSARRPDVPCEAEPRLAVVPDADARSAVISMRGRASLPSGPGRFWERSSALQAHRRWPPTVLPAARARGPAAPADRTTLTSDAAH